MMKRQIEVLLDKEALIVKATKIVVSKIEEAIANEGRCTIALAGGSTPRPLYESLATHSLPWQKIHFFWGDERYVPNNHPQSNQLMARQALLDRVAIPEANIHPIPTDSDNPQTDANRYEHELKDFFASDSTQIPKFDLILLGLGDDGHTASLFPDTEALQERQKTISVGEKSGEPRLTFTFPLLNQANCVLFLVAGENKSNVLKEILQPSPECLSEESKSLPYPASLVQPQGELLWLLDKTAASKLRNNQMLLTP